MEGSWGSTGDPSDLLLARGKKQRAKKDNDRQKVLAQVLEFCGESALEMTQRTPHSLRQILKHIREKTVNVQANKISHTHLVL